MHEYDISPQDYALHACLWMANILSPDQIELPQYHFYQPHYFGHADGYPSTTCPGERVEEQTQKKTLPSANTVRCATPPRAATFKVKEATNPKCAIGILQVILHTFVDNETQYYYSKKDITDDIVFVISRIEVRQLWKADRRHFNQYDASTQGRYLHDADMSLLTVMGKRTKLVGNDHNAINRVNTNLDLFLTKRSNGKISTVAWKPIRRDMPNEELRILQGYRQPTKMIPSTKKMYTLDDEGWGNKFDSKQEVTIRIIMEHVNNISSTRDFNLKLDNEKMAH